MERISKLTDAEFEKVLAIFTEKLEKKGRPYHDFARINKSTDNVEDVKNGDSTSSDLSDDDGEQWLKCLAQYGRTREEMNKFDLPILRIDKYAMLEKYNIVSMARLRTIEKPPTAKNCMSNLPDYDPFCSAFPDDDDYEFLANYEETRKDMNKLDERMQVEMKIANELERIGHTFKYNDASYSRMVVPQTCPSYFNVELTKMRKEPEEKRNSCSIIKSTPVTVEEKKTTKERKKKKVKKEDNRENALPITIQKPPPTAKNWRSNLPNDDPFRSALDSFDDDDFEQVLKSLANYEGTKDMKKLPKPIQVQMKIANELEQGEHTLQCNNVAFSRTAQAQAWRPYPKSVTKNMEKKQEENRNACSEKSTPATVEEKKTKKRKKKKGKAA